MSHAACTVNVVTTDGPAGRHGVTVSAMVSVSADTPQPTLLVCIHQLSPLAAARARERRVLRQCAARGPGPHLRQLRRAQPVSTATRNSNARSWTTQVTAAPRVVDALVAFDCRVTASERVGSHFVVFGSVQDIFVAGSGAPLIYANRAYGVPQRFHQRAQAPRTLGAVTRRTLSLGCFQTFAPYVVPALVARLTKLHPGIALTLLEADQSQVLASLAPRRYRHRAALRLRTR